MFNLFGRACVFDLCVHFHCGLIELQLELGVESSACRLRLRYEVHDANIRQVLKGFVRSEGCQDFEFCHVAIIAPLATNGNYLTLGKFAYMWLFAKYGKQLNLGKNTSNRLEDRGLILTTQVSLTRPRDSASCSASSGPKQAISHARTEDARSGSGLAPRPICRSPARPSRLPRSCLRAGRRYHLAAHRTTKDANLVLAKSGASVLDIVPPLAANKADSPVSGVRWTPPES